MRLFKINQGSNGVLSTYKDLNLGRSDRASWRSASLNGWCFFWRPNVSSSSSWTWEGICLDKNRPKLVETLNRLIWELMLDIDAHMIRCSQAYSLKLLVLIVRCWTVVGIAWNESPSKSDRRMSSARVRSKHRRPNGSVLRSMLLFHLIEIRTCFRFECYFNLHAAKLRQMCRQILNTRTNMNRT